MVAQTCAQQVAVLAPGLHLPGTLMYRKCPLECCSGIKLPMIYSKIRLLYNLREAIKKSCPNGQTMSEEAVI